jgi:hypothetical protein
MGNKIDMPKINHLLIEIAETTEINTNLLKNEFLNLFETLGGPTSNNIQFYYSDFKNYLCEFNEILFLNFTKNLLNYISIIRVEDLKYLKLSLQFLLLVIESIYQKSKNLQEMLIFSINLVLEKSYQNPSDEEMKNLIKNCFPFNILNESMDLFTNQETFIKSSKLSEMDKFEISHTLLKIIFNILNYQKNNIRTSRSNFSCFIEYFDSFKFFLSCEKLFPQEKIEKLISNLFSTFLLNLNSILNASSKKPEVENFIILSFQLLLYFCYDLNKFFFLDHTKEISNDGGCELLFENHFNEKVYRFVSQILFPLEGPLGLPRPQENSENSKSNILKIISNYSSSYKRFILNIVLYNTGAFKDFVFLFFSNYEKFNQRFKMNIKYFLIFIFEGNNVRND